MDPSEHTPSKPIKLKKNKETEGSSSSSSSSDEDLEPQSCESYIRIQHGKAFFKTEVIKNDNPVVFICYFSNFLLNLIFHGRNYQIFSFFQQRFFITSTFTYFSSSMSILSLQWQRMNLKCLCYFELWYKIILILPLIHFFSYLWDNNIDTSENW